MSFAIMIQGVAPSRAGDASAPRVPPNNGPQSPQNSDDKGPTPWPALHFGGRTVAVTAIGETQAIDATIAVELAAHLRSHKVAPGSLLLPTTYSLDDVIDECKAPKTNFAGAFVVLPALQASGSENYLVFTRSWTRISFAVAVLACDTASPPVDPKIMWVSDVTDGIKNRNSGSIAPLLAAAAIYAIVSPSKTRTVVNTRAFPANTPIPIGGQITTSQTTDTSVSNPSSASALSSQLFGVYAAQTSNIGALPSVDTQAAQAIENAAENVAKEIGNLCPPATPGDTPLPSVTAQPLNAKSPSPSAPPFGQNEVFCTW